MRLRFPHVVCALALLTAACGGGSGPTGPDAATPSGVPSIAGEWAGTADFERSNGQHLITNVALTMTQSDQNVSGSIRFPAAGWESWRGSLQGTVAGTVDPEFVGFITVQSEPATGTGVCTGQMTMSGRVSQTHMRWDAASMTMTNNIVTEAPACLGALRNIAWIFNR
jgi:hypothetical protein